MRQLEITEADLFATIGRLYVENLALGDKLDRLEQAIREAQQKQERAENDAEHTKLDGA